MSLQEKVRKVIDYARNLGKNGRVLGEDIKTLPGLTDPNILVRVAVFDGEDACWQCGKPLGDTQAGDYPLNSGGAWVRLHRKCAQGAARRYRG